MTTARGPAQPASNVTPVVLEDTGHWVIDERPDETAAALERSLALSAPARRPTA